MYAFIVNEAWKKFAGSDRTNDFATFLRVVGTPCLTMSYDAEEQFNNVSGFYVKLVAGWAVRYRSELLTVTEDPAAAAAAATDCLTESMSTMVIDG
jgi:hypothetical protein